MQSCEVGCPMQEPCLIITVLAVEIVKLTGSCFR